MKEIILGEKGNYNTPLYNVIKSIPENILHHSQHELRHPLGIYTTSTSRVFKAFNKLLECLYIEDELDVIDLCHKELLNSLMAYIDDGYHIIKCLYPKDMVTKKITFADRWLEAVDRDIITNYKEKIKPFSNKLNLIVNKTKHNHARYCHIKISERIHTIKGYYIEGINTTGVIYPDREIHSLYEEMFTGISYNKDILNQFINFYYISKHIAQTIKMILKKHYGMVLGVQSFEYNEDDKILDIFNKIQSLDKVYFPNEYSEVPQILIESGIIKIRRVAYSSYTKKLIKLHNFRVELMIQGDGSTVSWTLPYYMGEDSN